MDYKEINNLTGKISKIKSLLEHSSQIEMIATNPNAGYGASIYDAAEPTIITVKLEKDEAEFLLNEYQNLIEQKVDSVIKVNKKTNL